MGIAEMIQRKKQEFFVARDSDKLALQRDILEKERASLQKERQDVESIRKLQDDIRSDRSAIREARTSGSRKVVAGFISGVKKMNDNLKKTQATQNVNSPFFTGGVTERRIVPPKKEKSKTVVVRIQP